jgi:hypothetical protein
MCYITHIRGSTYQLLKYFSRLTVNVYDFDSASTTSPLVGPSFQTYASYSNSLPMSTPHVGYRVVDTTGLSLQDAKDDILHEKAWAAIVIHANATTSWRNAVQQGDTGYSELTQGTVGIYYEGARYYQVLLLYLRPFVSSLH